MPKFKIPMFGVWVIDDCNLKFICYLVLVIFPFNDSEEVNQKTSSERSLKCCLKNRKTLTLSFTIPRATMKFWSLKPNSVLPGRTG